MFDIHRRSHDTGSLYNPFEPLARFAQTQLSRIRKFIGLAALAAAWSALGPPAARGAPVYVQEHGYANRSVVVKGINNAGDVTGWYQTAAGDPSAFLMRDGVIHDLLPTGTTPLIFACYANGLSQRKPDGSVAVVGFVHQSDGFTRGIVWTVAANGTFSSQVLSNLVLPPESTAPGEQGYAEAVSINQDGVIVGDGNSYIAGLGLKWTPPYGKPVTYFYSTGTTADVIDDQGNVLLNGAEFDHNETTARYNAALLSAGGNLQELPYTRRASGITTQANALSGLRVAGRTAGDDGYSHAFVWTNGAAALFPLPDPAGMPVQESEGQSVNAAGDVVGYAYVASRASGNFSPGYYAMLWKNSPNGYTGYVLTSLFALENLGTGPIGPSNFRINDRGEVALFGPFGSSYELRVYQPLTNGVVQFSTTSYSVAETDGFIEATASLLRADDFTGPVTVAFTTSNGDAVAGVDFVARSGTVSWSAGVSGAKPVRITLIDDLVFTHDRSFNLNLTAATGSQLGIRTNASIYITETPQTVAFTNQWLAEYGGYAVKAGETNLTVTLIRDGGADGNLVITNFSTADGSAFAGVDFVGVTNVTHVTWSPGQAGKTIYAVPLLPLARAQPTTYFYVLVHGYIDDPTNSIFGYATVCIVPVGEKPATRFETSAPMAQNGMLKLSSFLTEGLTLVIESSTNLVKWNLVTEVKSTNGVVQFEPVIQQMPPALFYRSSIK